MLKRCKLSFSFIALSTLVFALLFSSCRSETKPDRTNKTEKVVKKNEVDIVKPVIVRIFPHDVEAYTQGLFYKDGFLYESTGQKGASSLRKVNPETGEVVKIVKLDDMYFGEGITEYQNKIYMLTWITNKGFIFDFKNFNKIGEFEYMSEGWGLASDDKQFYFTDGSSLIRYMNFKDFSQKGFNNCSYKSKLIDKLNELEIVGDTLYANIYTYDIIARINKKTGEVYNLIDCSSLRSKLSEPNRAEVMNGIAYNPETKTYILTGKYWDKYFEVKFK